MKDIKQAGSISLPKSKKQCKLYQQLGIFAENLDQLPDTDTVLKDRVKSAPLELVPMVF
jgi:hypothetical protein